MAYLEVKDRVQRMLSELVGKLELDSDGDFTFSFESTRVYVAVREVEALEISTVRVGSVLLFEVPGSPGLFEDIATSALGYRFGSLALYKREDGLYNVNFSHTLVGDTLDPDELRHALGAVAVTADKLDDELKSKYGGRRWADIAAS